LQISRIIHTNVVCADIERSLKFYTQVLGAKVHERVDDGGADIRESLGVTDGPVRYRAALLYWDDNRGGPYVDLLEWQATSSDRVARPPLSAQDYGYARMAFEVDDVVAAERELQEAGLSWVGPIQEARVGPWVVKMVCCRDPDGSLIELTEFPYGKRRGRAAQPAD